MVQCRVYSLVEGGPGGLERRRRGGDPVEQAGLLGRRHRAGVRGLSGTSMARGMERRGACVIGTPGRRGPTGDGASSLQRWNPSTHLSWRYSRKGQLDGTRSDFDRIAGPQDGAEHGPRGTREVARCGRRIACTTRRWRHDRDPRRCTRAVGSQMIPPAPRQRRPRPDAHEAQRQSQRRTPLWLPFR